MPLDEAAQHRWCRQARVLLNLRPSDPPETPDDAPTHDGRILLAWEAAEAMVQMQFEKLRSAFRSTGTAAGRKIADQGFDRLAAQIVGGLRPTLAAYKKSKGADHARARAMLSRQVAALNLLLDSHPAFPVLERNPFGISVTLRSDIKSTLRGIESALARSE